MKEDWVPIELPENFDEILEKMSNSREPRVGWCFLCGGPIRREDDFIPNTNTHNCDAGRKFEAEHATLDDVVVQRTRCRDGRHQP